MGRGKFPARGPVTRNTNDGIERLSLNTAVSDYNRHNLIFPLHMKWEKSTIKSCGAVCTTVVLSTDSTHHRAVGCWSHPAVCPPKRLSPFVFLTVIIMAWERFVNRLQANSGRKFFACVGIGCLLH